MHRSGRIVAAALVGGLALAASGAAQRPAEPARFHHLHLSAYEPRGTADFYGRLFEARAIQRGVFWGIEGLRGRSAYLLVTAPSEPGMRDEDTALWHFGWGRVSLGESYREHYLHEVNWRPPYASLEREFHLHLRSARPRAAAAWYGDVLGAEVELAGTAAPPAGTDRIDAIVRFGSVVLAVHAVAPATAFPPSRGRGRMDHLAFVVRDLEAALRAAGDGRPAAIEPLPLPDTDRLPSIFVQAPDGVAVELLKAPRGPAFWH